MKTILIPLKGLQPIEMSKLMRSLGLVIFSLKEDDPKVEFSQQEKEIKPIEGLTGKPEFFTIGHNFEEHRHWWSGFKLSTNAWSYFRIDITETGEQILKDNQIEYEYE